MRTLLTLLPLLTLYSSPILAAETASNKSLTRTENVKFVVGNDLWQPGHYYKPGRDWLALVCDVKGCALSAASLTVKQESWQGNYDDEPTLGQHLTFTVANSTDSEVVAWFNTSASRSWLKPGNVVTYYSPQRPLKQPTGRGTLEAMIELPQGEVALLVPLLETKSYLRKSRPESDISWPEVILQLRANHKRQILGGVLGACDGTFHPRDYLLWAGDIDRDAKPDYLITDADQGSDTLAFLYLSSLAGPEQLVGLGGTYNFSPSGGECDGTGGYMTYMEEGADGME